MSEKKNEKCKSILSAKSPKIKGQNTHRFITLTILITVFSNEEQKNNL